MLCTTVFGQKSFKASKSTSLEIDQFEQLYIINESNVIQKFNNKGELLRKFSSKKYGFMDYADVSNPLHIVCFFRNQNKIILLDSELSMKGEIKLRPFGINEASAISASHDGRYWVYDREDNKLFKIAKNSVLQESNNMDQILGKPIEVIRMQEEGKWLYVTTTEEILVFDLFAKYYKTIPIRSTLPLQVRGDLLFYYKMRRIHSYNLQTLETNLVRETPEALIDFKLGNHRLFLLGKNNVDLHSLN